jgi:transposase
LFVDAMLWLVQAGAPWRDLPEEFGKWNGVFKRSRRWAKRASGNGFSPNRAKILTSST